MAGLKRTAALADVPAMWTRGFRAFLLLLLLVVTAGAAEALRVNVDMANPPFMYARNGLPEGIYPALLREAFRRMGMPLALEAKPWQRCLHELDNGLAGVGGLYKSADRQTKYDYSEPFFVETLMLYFHVSRPIPSPRVEELKHLRIGVLNGWSYGDDFDRSRKAGIFWIEEVATDAQNFMKLADRRLDAVIAVHESGAALLARHSNLRAAKTPFLQNPVYLAFAKHARQGAILKRFDVAMQAMRRSGVLKQIVEIELREEQ